MESGSWIHFLEIFSLISTGLFGVLALVTKYKTDDGRMTGWGKTALAGIVVSTSVSLALQKLKADRRPGGLLSPFQGFWNGGGPRSWG